MVAGEHPGKSDQDCHRSREDRTIALIFWRLFHIRQNVGLRFLDRFVQSRSSATHAHGGYKNA
jgi:hypothetical protein